MTSLPAVSILPPMRARLAVPVLLVLACGGPRVDPDASLSDLTYQEQGVPFVDPDDLRAWMQAGHADEVVFVDNRNGFAFQQLRIEGARLVPTDGVEANLGSLPLNRWLIMYCT